MKHLFTFKSLILLVLVAVATSVKAQDYTALYLIGDVVSTGWNIGAPTPMVQDAENDKIFTWTGALNAGIFKISTFTGDWCDGDWLNSTVDSQPITEATYIITTGCDGPDNKWLVSEEDAGTCKIIVDLENQTIVYEKLSDEIADASLATLSASVGVISPDFDASIALYTLTVPGGTTAVELSAETSDSGATVSGAGNIEIAGEDTTVTLIVTASDGIVTLTYTINIIIATEGEVYSNLYMVGDATPAGWNIAEPEPMTQDTENPKVFTWQGPLLAGEFKFPAFKGDWCDGDWLLALAPDQTITEGEYGYTVYTGCAPGEEDFKWRVQEGEEGDYMITVDFENENINIEAINSGVGVDNLNVSSFTCYPNPAFEQVTLQDEKGMRKIEILDNSGKFIHQYMPNANSFILDVSSLNNGIYFVKTTNNDNNTSVKKLVVRK